MVYKVKKSIPQYSLVDILEVLLNKNNPDYSEVKSELEKRNPSKKEIELAKKGLEIRLKARNKPLSFFDKLYCLIIPFFYGKKDFDFHSINDAFSDHLSEFEFYGESRRVAELKKWQKYSLYFYLFVAIIILVYVITYEFL